MTNGGEILPRPAGDLPRVVERIYRLISQPAPVGEHARILSAQDPGIWPLSTWIDGPDEAYAVARIEIYSRMHFARVHDSLKEDFPCLYFVLGAQDFATLVADYVQAHPSSSPSLRHLGAGVPAYVETHLVSNRRADLADLSKLEWARVSVFDEPNLAPLEVHELAGLSPAQWADLRLHCVPASRIVSTRHSIDALWLKADRNQEVPAVAEGAQSLLVWRKDFTVRHRVIPAPELDALSRVLAGQTFASVCESIAAGAPDVAAATERAFVTLRQWVSDGLLLRDTGTCE